MYHERDEVSGEPVPPACEHAVLAVTSSSVSITLNKVWLHGHGESRGAMARRDGAI